VTDAERPVEDEGLPGEALVVRGGEMASKYLFIAAKKHQRLHPGVWAISVASVPGLSAEEIAKRSPFIKAKQMRTTTADALRKEGYEVEPDGSPHALIHLPRAPQGEDDPMWDHLRSILSDIRPNPNYEGG
jgi:hypothetical protein